MDIPQLTEWFKAVAPAIAVGALFWKTGHGLRRLRRRRWIEEFKLSRSVLRRGIEHVHPFELESWYTAVSGGAQLCYAKIRCALESGAPNEVFLRLRRSDQYTKVMRAKDGTLTLVEAAPVGKLTWWLRGLGGLYLFFAGAAGLPIFARPFLPELDSVGVIAYALLVSLPCTWLALLCLWEGRKVRAAIGLVKDFQSLSVHVAEWTPAPAAPPKSTRKAHQTPKAASAKDAQAPS